MLSPVTVCVCVLQSTAKKEYCKRFVYLKNYMLSKPWTDLEIMKCPGAYFSSFKVMLDCLVDFRKDQRRFGFPAHYVTFIVTLKF